MRKLREKLALFSSGESNAALQIKWPQAGWLADSLNRLGGLKSMKWEKYLKLFSMTGRPMKLVCLAVPHCSRGY